jgi:hypothetical protein
MALLAVGGRPPVRGAGFQLCTFHYSTPNTAPAAARRGAAAENTRTTKLSLAARERKANAGCLEQGE